MLTTHDLAKPARRADRGHESPLLPDFARLPPANPVFVLRPFALPAVLSKRLDRLADADALRSFAMVVASGNLVAARTSGISRLLVGIPPLRGAASAGGLLPLLTELSDEMAIGDYVDTVATALYAAYGRWAVPAGGPAGAGEREPPPALAYAFASLHGDVVFSDVRPDLALAFVSVRARLTGHVHYRADLFSPQTVERFLLGLTRMLCHAVRRDRTAIASVPLLTPAERRRLLRRSRPIVAGYPTDRTIHALFEERAVRYADRVAIEDGRESLTYRELDAAANHVAWLLHDRGLRRGEFVAILHERGARYLVFVLAVLKAGGAFVPIDPAYPRDRVLYMLEDCAARFVLSNAEAFKLYAETIVGGLRRMPTVILSDRAPGDAWKGGIPLFDSADIGATATGRPELALCGRDLCYMIYTSGSTGRPKGTLVRHDGAINHIYAQFDALGLTPDTAFVQSAPISSDISIWQYLGPILIGGRVIVVDTPTVFDAEALLRIMKERRATIVEYVPAIVRSLLDYVSGLDASARRLPALAWMMVTGEQVPVDLVNRWLSLYPGIPVVNAYGPSEASDDVCQAVIAAPLQATCRSTPIGRPLANCFVYILDRHLKLVPPGAPGEICLGGICVGEGYWRKPEITAASFVPDPFDDEPGAIMYRTGDLGRWPADGEIEFLGRIDHQVKLRGHRIELEEIEAVIRQHPLVTDAIATVWDDPESGRRLLAYIVTIGGEQPTPAAWRAFLMDRLPEHMIPSQFIPMDRLPLTPAGKFDRRGLPPPTWAREALGEAYVAPRSAAERMLAELWAHHLRTDRVGIRDNFFELGGDSITAIQIAAQAGNVGLRLKPTDICSHPTIEGLARIAAASFETAMALHLADSERRLARVPSAAQSDRVIVKHLEPVAFQRLGSGNCAIPALTSDSFDALKRRYGAIVDAYPLVAAQRGIYVRCLFAPGTAVYIEQTSLDLDGDIDTAALAAAWQSIIDHHPALRTAFFRLPGIREPLQVVLEHVDAAFSHEDWRHLEAAAAAAHWTERLSDDRRRPFRPAAPPLCRLCLVRLGDTRWRLLLSYSHLVMDGWSEPIVLRELFDKHRRFRAGAAIIDPPSPTYRHFVTWLLRQDLRAAEEHWRRKLAGYTTPTRLAAEKAHAVHGATALEEQFGAVSIRLDAARCQALRAFARDYQITFNSVLQAAFGLCLGVASGTNDVMFGSVVSGRNAPIEGIGAMVGMAANTLPVRLQIEPERPIGAWLQNFQTELFEMLAYDWSPLSWVQRWSDVPAENLPLLRSLFVLANYPNATTIHSNAPTVTAIDLSTTPDFPLSLFVVPNDDLFVRAAYSKDVFEAPDVSAFLGVYARVLDAFVAMPAASVGALLDTIASEHRNTAPLAAPGMDGPI